MLSRLNYLIRVSYAEVYPQELKYINSMLRYPFSFPYIYKTLVQKYDPILQCKLYAQGKAQARNTRHNHKLCLSHCNRSKTQFGIFYSRVKLFNPILGVIYSYASLNGLKKKIRQNYIIQN